MKVLKFGGTSVGTPEAMWRVLDILTQDGQPKLTVLSAKAGTTDKLKRLADHLGKSDRREAEQAIAALRAEYQEFIYQLLQTETWRSEALEALEFHLEMICAELDLKPEPRQEKVILAQGELLSSTLFHLLCKEVGEDAILIPALDIIRINEFGEADLDWITLQINAFLAAHPGRRFYITQGYIGRNPAGEIDNLGRGGSDLSATLLGAAIGAEEIQIWSDIDGVHINDPRFVKGTYPVRCLSYREASSLAYFGAKVLHPLCVVPAEKKNIPLILKNTFNPCATGTLISHQVSDTPILLTAVSSRDGITCISVRSHRDRPACEFFSAVFEVFRRYKITLDMTTTSEVDISVTMSQTPQLSTILDELALLGEVEYNENLCIVNVVGKFQQTDHTHLADLFPDLKGIPLRMIACAPNQPNLLFVVDAEYKTKMLQIFQENIYRTNISRMLVLT